MGFDWLCRRRACRIILWLARAFRRPGDWRDRGRTDWRKETRESRTGRLGDIPGQPWRVDRKAIHRADHDHDFSDERAVATVVAAVSSGKVRSATEDGGASRKVETKFLSALTLCVTK